MTRCRMSTFYTWEVISYLHSTPLTFSTGPMIMAAHCFLTGLEVYCADRSQSARGRGRGEGARMFPWQKYTQQAIAEGRGTRVMRGLLAARPVPCPSKTLLS